MLHILFMILKIIGIILLTMLGILILLFCAVNFVPARYQMIAELKGNLKSANVRVKFSWLLYLISGQVIYENEKFDWKVRVAWKKFPQIKRKQEISKHTEISEMKKDEEAKPTQQTEQKKETKSESVQEAKIEKKSIFEKIKYTFQKICDKIKAIANMKDKIVAFLADEAHLATFVKLKKEISRLAKFLKPKKLKGTVYFGMEDPYQTGQVLAILSVLYPFYGENVEIYPQFDRKILEGDLYIKGQIRGVYALILAWNLIFDKNVRTMIKNIKTLK